MLVLIYHPQAEQLAARVRQEKPHLEVLAATDPSRLQEHLTNAEILLATGFARFDFSSARCLRWVQIWSAGVDQLAEILPPGVLLTRGYGLHNASVSEHCLGRILAHALNLRQALQNQAEGKWQRYPVERVSGKVLGLAGLGVIGSAIAKKARAFDMHVTGLRRVAGAVDGVDRVYGLGELHEFIATADYLVILLPLTPETRGMFGTREFAAMKQVPSWLAWGEVR